MSLVINHNIPALSAYNEMAAINENLAKAIEKTSSGLRLNRAGDDAAGLAVSEKMQAQAEGLAQASGNTQDGISLIQTAEGALSETHDILERMRELAVQSANGTLTQQDRAFVHEEVSRLREEVDRIANTAQYNKKKLLNGDAAALWSSDKLETKALIHGGLREVDDFGQKTSAEGNYNIDITATPGQGQVQKSQIITPPLRTEEVPHDISCITGMDNVGKTSGKGWSFEDGVLTIFQNGTYSIIGSPNEVTTNRIVVEEGVEATIFLKDVNIDVSGDSALSAFEIMGATVDLYLEGENTLISGSTRAGLEVQSVDGGQAGSLTISSAAGDSSTEGKLTAISKNTGAGSGGAFHHGDRQRDRPGVGAEVEVRGVPEPSGTRGEQHRGNGGEPEDGAEPHTKREFGKGDDRVYEVPDQRPGGTEYRGSGEPASTERAEIAVIAGKNVKIKREREFGEFGGLPLSFNKEADMMKKVHAVILAPLCVLRALKREDV